MFTVHSVRGEYIAVVETVDLAAFHVASRGAQGQAGWSGSIGSAGMSGSDCSDGGPGGRGSDGDNGGNGGDGGNINVVIACGLAPCDVDLIKGIVFSAGGAGEWADRAAPAVPAAPGEAVVLGRPTLTAMETPSSTILGARLDSPGPSGPSGANGWPGRAGSPGRVAVQVVR